MGEVALILTDDVGQRIGGEDGTLALSRASRISATRTANRIAPFVVTLPGDIDPELVRDDNMVQVWYKPNGGTYGLWRIYFIRRRRWWHQDGQEFLEISGPDCNDLLRRRIVAERDGTSVSEKTQTVDDMMKEVLFEALSSGVNPSPDYGSRALGNLEIEDDTSLGPIVRASFPWEKLLTYGNSGIFPKLAEAARAEEVPIYFDIIPHQVTSSAVSFRFITRAYRYGRDLTDTVTFSLSRGNMENPEYIEDSTKAENYIYAGGQGGTVSQHVEQVYDEARIGKSEWGRIEGYADASSQPDDAVADAGRSVLTSRRPKTSFFADPISTQESVFRRDWDFGDEVKAIYHGEFSAIIESTTITVEDGKETVEARLRSET